MKNQVEKEYISGLVDQKFDQLKLKDGLISDEVKAELDKYPEELKEYLADNSDFDNYSTEEKDQKFNAAIEILERFKTSIRTAECKLSLKGRDIIWIKNRIEDDVELTSESVFVAIHLYGTWLKDIQTNINESSDATIQISMPNSVVLYDLLSGLKYKGLSQKALIYAKILRELAECSKYFQHYNSAADRAYKSISEWNLGLSNDEKSMVKGAILKEAMESAQNND